MWLNKNILKDETRAAGRIKTVKWVCIGLLLATATISSHLLPLYVTSYEAVVRFAIVLGAIAILFESLPPRQYAFTALFAAVVVLFNPLVPMFTLAQNRLVLVASVLPFVASLLWTKERTRRACVPTPDPG